MKTKSKLHNWVHSAMVGLAMAASSSLCYGASDIIIGPQGTEASISNPDGTWINMWGPAFAGTAWDPSTPPPSGDTLGSVFNYGNWTGAAQDNMNMVSPGNWWGAVYFDGSQYTSIEMDIKYDVTSTMTPTSAAHLEIGFMNGYGFIQITNVSFNTASSPLADGTWHHLSIPISASQSGISSVSGVGYYQWNASALGTMSFWMANVKLIARIVPVAPPTLSVPTKATQGLNVFASTAGLSDRQSAKLIQSTGNSWVGQATVANPVTYSFTIKSFPNDPATYGCEAYLFLVPNLDYNETKAPDWNETNCVVIYIQQGSTNATMHFQYKVNEANQQAMYSGGSETRTTSTTTNNYIYSEPVGSLPGGPITVTLSPGVYNITNETGNLGSVTNPLTALGTWTIKFTSDTDVTLIAPGGNTSSFVIPPYNAGYFAGSSTFSVYLGMQANNAATLNQAVVYSNFAISGTATPFSENFLTDTVLDTTNVWDTVVASGPAGVLIVPASAAYWINWTLPDSGFSLEIAPTLTNPLGWTTPTIGPIITLSGRSQLIATSELPAGNAAFFRLIKRVFTQLQVLLPGETNAPNTLTGKTGTPTPVNVNDLVNVTVNAVDATWNIVNVSGDTIHLTTTDGTAITPLDAPLANGTLTGPNQVIQFGSPGSFTVTATDTTNTNIPPSISASLTVN